MSLPRYSKYKSSGVQWLGMVPSHWTVMSIKRLSPVQRGASPRPIDDPKYFDDDGEYSWVRIADVSASDGVLRTTTQRMSQLGASLSAKIAPGELFVSIAGTVGKPCISAIKACIHDGFVYFPHLKIAPEFLYRIFEAGACFGGLGKFGTQLNLNTDTIGSICVAVPPEEELRHILSFLDRETAKIDSLIAEQENLIVLLAEKRQATISHAATCGLCPDALLKESGMAWLGSVPAHWNAKPLKALFRQQKRQSFPEKDVLSVYRDFGVIRKDSRTDNFNKTPDDLSSYQLVEPNDLVVNKMKGWQGSLGVSQFEGITSPDYMVFTPLHLESSEYLHILLRSTPMVSTYRSISNGIRPAQWRLEPESFLRLKVFLPPVEEQQAIVAFCKSEMHKLDLLTSETEAMLTLLKERRNALIAAVVTGQIDVRSAARQATAGVEAMAA